MTFLPLFDKHCEVYVPEKNEWKYPYQHLVERYYLIYKHLANNIQNSVNFLHRKTPKEIEDFYRETFLSITNK